MGIGTTINTEHRMFDTIELLTARLEQAPPVKDLVVIGGDLEVEEYEKFTKFTEALKNAKELDSLNFYRIKLGDEGARAIADVIEKSNSLTSLHLTSNDIGSEGLISIASALEKNKALDSIVIANNGLGNNEAIAIVNALKGHKNLRTIIFSSKPDPDMEGAKAIANALEANGVLTRVSFFESEEQNIIDKATFRNILAHNFVDTFSEFASQCTAITTTGGSVTESWGKEVTDFLFDPYHLGNPLKVLLNLDKLRSFESHEGARPLNSFLDQSPTFRFLEIFAAVVQEIDPIFEGSLLQKIPTRPINEDDSLEKSTREELCHVVEERVKNRHARGAEGGAGDGSEEILMMLKIMERFTRKKELIKERSASVVDGGGGGVGGGSGSGSGGGDPSSTVVAASAGIVAPSDHSLDRT